MSGERDHVILHGSAVAVAGRGILIFGASGAGKSALALRMLARGADLVADDRVMIERRGKDLVASAPAPLAGLIEARGVGILRVAAVPDAPVRLAVDLDRPPAARMPQRHTITLLDASIRLISGRDVPDLDATLTVLMQNGGVLLE